MNFLKMDVPVTLTPVTLTRAATRFFPLLLSLGLTPVAGLAQDASDPALTRCLAQAGSAGFTLPVPPEKVEAIRAAEAACDAAIADGTATAEVHFLMGMLMQSEGALAAAMDHYRQAAWLAMHSGGDVAHAARDPEPEPQAAPEAPAGPGASASEAESTPEETVVAGGAGNAAQATAADDDASDSGAAGAEMAGDDASAPPKDAVQTETPDRSAGTGQTAPVEQAAPAAPETPAMTAADYQSRPPLEGCTALAGPPDSGVPVSPAALEATLAALKAARPFCERAVADGSADAAAYFQLAVLLQAEGDHRKALEYFGKAAQMGLAAAHSKLGDYFLFGIGPVKADLDKAVAHYQQAEAGGDLAAMTTMAFLYRLGRGVPRDPVQMIERMRKAADGGYQFAQYRLAQIYLTGDGIPGGSDAALGIPNPELGVKYLEMAARAGNSKAILELAQLYADDGNGVAADPEAYVLWTEKAADTGDAAAIAALGYLYETGTGVAPDPARAAALYVEALESGKISFAALRRGQGGRAARWDKDTARAFQTILRERGLYDGAIDGIVGPITAAAAARLGR
ncbi:MAG TPA: hypothetical protein ENJ52_09365 [Aliiroseovarius sp.]|nr:hypothetical protein [Aliiroseovarius sp.]